MPSYQRRRERPWFRRAKDVLKRVPAQGLIGASERGSLRAMQHLDSDELARLSPEERLALIGQLWDSLSENDVPLPEAQKAELARRLSSFDQDRTQAVTWEQLRAELARRRP